MLLLEPFQVTAISSRVIAVLYGFVATVLVNTCEGTVDRPCLSCLPACLPACLQHARAGHCTSAVATASVAC